MPWKITNGKVTNGLAELPAILLPPGRPRPGQLRVGRGSGTPAITSGAHSVPQKKSAQVVSTSVPRGLPSGPRHPKEGAGGLTAGNTWSAVAELGGRISLIERDKPGSSHLETRAHPAAARAVQRPCGDYASTAAWRGGRGALTPDELLRTRRAPYPALRSVIPGGHKSPSTKEFCQKSRSNWR